MTGRRSCAAPVAFCLTAFALPLSSCGHEPNAKPAQPSIQITGFEQFQFGMSFESTSALVDISQFNSVSVKNCLEDRALRGCGLSQDEGDTPQMLVSGIPYLLGLEFNRYDRLVDVRLQFRRSGHITSAECQDIHARSLDWLVRRYGKFAEPTGPRPKVTEGKVESSITQISTPYSLWRADDGDFVTEPARNIGRSTFADRKRPIPAWNQDRYVSLMTTFVGTATGSPTCDVSIEWEEPPSVERSRLSAEDQAEQDRISAQIALEISAKRSNRPTIAAPATERSDVPVCDRPDSPEKRALLKKLDVGCDDGL